MYRSIYIHAQKSACSHAKLRPTSGNVDNEADEGHDSVRLLSLTGFQTNGWHLCVARDALYRILVNSDTLRHPFLT